MRKFYTTLLILVLVSSIAGVGLTQAQPKPTNLLQFGQANVQGTRAPSADPNLVKLIDQAPNGQNGIFVDSTCDLCGTGQQSVGDNFKLTGSTTIEQIVFWTGYFPSDAPLATDLLTVIFHQDGGGIPGTVVSSQSNVPYTREQTGVVLFGVHEWKHTLTLATPVTLGAGTFWLEIFNNTGFTGTDFFWETGNQDPTNGIYDAAFAFETPGVTWNAPLGYDMAFQLWTGGEPMLPDILVTPGSLTANLAPNQTEDQFLNIANVGTADLTWTLTEQPVIAGSMPFVPVKVSGTGIGNPKLGVASHSNLVSKPEAPVNPQAVLWDQPVSSFDTNAYVDMEFVTPYEGYSSFLADDFTNAGPWNISTIYVPGYFWNGGTTMLNALNLTWQIYADCAGVPCGDPSGGGAAPIWTYSALPTSPEVTLSMGTGGYLSNTTLTLTTPVNVPAGNWWLIFYPLIDFEAGGGQFGRQGSDTNNGTIGYFINPGGGFGLGTGWQPWTIINATTHDIAFRLEGDSGPAPEIPWLSENPTSGTVPAGSSTDVTVTFDSTGLAVGSYFGNLSIKSNDPDQPEVIVPVTLNVTEGGNTLHLNATRAYGQFGPPGHVKLIELVRVFDQNFMAVSGVSVFGEWTLPNGTVLQKSANWVTNYLGDTKFQLKGANPGVYQFCVTDMVLAGFTYDPNQNEVDPCQIFIVQ